MLKELYIIRFMTDNIATQQFKKIQNTLHISNDMLAAASTSQDKMTLQSQVKKWQWPKWEERAAAMLILVKLSRKEKVWHRTIEKLTNSLIKSQDHKTYYSVLPFPCNYQITSVPACRRCCPLRFVSNFKFKQTSNSKQNSDLPSLCSDRVTCFWFKATMFASVLLHL